jgi:cell division protein FtsX
MTKPTINVEFKPWASQSTVSEARRKIIQINGVKTVKLSKRRNFMGLLKNLVLFTNEKSTTSKKTI